MKDKTYIYMHTKVLGTSISIAISSPVDSPLTPQEVARLAENLKDEICIAKQEFISARENDDVDVSE